MLASAWLSKNVGLKGVAKAITLYAKGMQGNIAPGDAYTNFDWLSQAEYY